MSPYLLETIQFGLLWFIIGWLAWKIGEQHRV